MGQWHVALLMRETQNDGPQSRQDTNATGKRATPLRGVLASFVFESGYSFLPRDLFLAVAR